MEQQDNLISEISRRNFVRGAGILAVGVGAAGLSPLQALAAPMAPKKGGTLRVGVVGGTDDIIDAQYLFKMADVIRLNIGWEGLMNFDEKFKPSTVNGLAESVEVKSLTEYVIKMKKGIEFHNGKTMNMDDVIYSWQRMVDPALPGTKALAAYLNAGGLKKIDANTFKMTLLQPNADWLTTFAQYACTIVPVGYTRTGPQVGTGPYKLKSFTPGVESTHVRHANYWDSGKPYLDAVRVINFSSTDALVNALLAGQVDAAVGVPAALVPAVKKDKKLKVIETSAGKIAPIVLPIDEAPFNDVRVRKALRMMIDRKKIIKQALSGHGTVANDDFSPIDSNYNANGYKEPKQDLAGGLALLKAAGYSKSNPLKFTLWTGSDNYPEVAKAFAEQINSGSGGVAKIEVGVPSDYWDTKYMAKGVGAYTTYWNPKPYLVQAGQMLDVYDETHLAPKGANSPYRKWFEQAVAEPDAAKRRELIKKMQAYHDENGGYIIPFFLNVIDAHSTKVQGIVQRPASLNLDTLGMHFKNVWLA
jgi:peptide/nickel transport system substrate-binding protein